MPLQIIPTGPLRMTVTVKNRSTHLSILFVTTSTLFSFFFSDIPLSEMKITLKPVSVRMLTIACYFIFLARFLPLVHPFSRNYQHSHLVDDVRFTKLSAKKVKKSKQRNTIGEFCKMCYLVFMLVGYSVNYVSR